MAKLTNRRIGGISVLALGGALVALRLIDNGYFTNVWEALAHGASDGGFSLGGGALGTAAHDVGQIVGNTGQVINDPVGAVKATANYIFKDGTPAAPMVIDGKTLTTYPSAQDIQKDVKASKVSCPSGATLLRNTVSTAGTTTYACAYNENVPALTKTGSWAPVTGGTGGNVTIKPTGIFA